MNNFEPIITEKELKEIEKIDSIYIADAISIDDTSNQFELDCYVYELYLKENYNNSQTGYLNE